MEVHVSIKNAIVRIYRGGNRKYWDYHDRQVYAKYFNVQASRYSPNPDGRPIRVCYEFTSADEDELNDIASHGEESVWDISGNVRDFKVVTGLGREKEPEQRVYVKLDNVQMRLCEPGDMENIHHYNVVPEEQD